MARVRAVLFDIDGTLLDSNDAHAHAWLDALRGHGKNVPFDLVRSKIGMGGDKLLREVVELEDDSVEGRSITDRRVAILKAHYLPDIGPFPGARALVDRLRSRGLICAAVTSAKSADVADLLRVATVADLIDPVITSDDADASKPDPDLVEIAVQRLGLEKNECVMVGDTPFDIEAATRAGVATIAFRCGGWSDRDLDGAIAIYDGPGDLSSKLDDSVFARGLDDSDRDSVRSFSGRRPSLRRPPRMGGMGSGA
jgi:beta-phosphoglucomutase-like phosphatase (HAD superfamily)